MKNNERPESFMPGEYVQINSIYYLEPTHIYSGEKAKSPVKQPEAGDLFDMLDSRP